MAAPRVALRGGVLGFLITGTAAAVLVRLGRNSDAIVLTVTAAVGIINALWLERALAGLLQPGRPRVTRGTAALLVGRWGLWAVLFTGLYVYRRYVDVWAVIGGVGCFIVALAGAGLRTAGDDPGEE